MRALLALPQILTLGHSRETHGSLFAALLVSSRSSRWLHTTSDGQMYIYARFEPVKNGLEYWAGPYKEKADTPLIANS